MKIGIFGGTFDPPHIGHLILAEEARAQLELDQVLWVLTPYPPHKTRQKISPLDDRLSMVLLAIAGNAKFRLSRVDIDRKPPHYALDTVSILRQASPRDQYYYLMGADSLNDLSNWHEPAKFVSICDGIGVMQRQGDTVDTSQLESKFPKISEKLHFLSTPFIDISGVDIRSRAGSGRQFRYFVPDKVYLHILNHKLYQP